MTTSPGTELGPLRIESVDPEKMKTFAVVLADPNPIHLDPEAAKAAGLGERVVNQGPTNLGYVLNMLREAVPGAVIRDLNVRLTGIVVGGDTAIVAGEVESAQDVGREQLLRCRVWLDVEGGRRAIEGTATLAVSSRPS